MTVARNDPLITGYRLDHAAGQATVALTISRGTETASGTIKLGGARQIGWRQSLPA